MKKRQTTNIKTVGQNKEGYPPFHEDYFTINLGLYEKMHGIYRKYDLNWNLLEKTTYKYGKKHGTSILYHSNSVIAEKSEYKYNVLNGVSIKYDEQGVEIERKIFKSGKEIKFEKTSQLKKIIYFLNRQIKSK